MRTSTKQDLFECRTSLYVTTRLLAINVSIPNLTVARLQHFPSPQMTDNKPSFTRKPHVVIFRQSSFAANAVPKLVAMATSLSRRVTAISAFCRPTTQTPPSKTNRLVAIVHTKPVIALLVPKLVAMATSLRPSISARSSLDSLIPKTCRQNQTASR